MGSVIHKPVFDAGTTAFGLSLVVLILGVRALARRVAESDLPLVGGAS